MNSMIQASMQGQGGQGAAQALAAQQVLYSSFFLLFCPWFRPWSNEEMSQFQAQAALLQTILSLPSSSNANAMSALSGLAGLDDAMNLSIKKEAERQQAAQERQATNALAIQMLQMASVSGGE